MKQNKLIRIFGSVTGIILLSKLMGFVKQMITASAFGATLETDLISLSEGFIANLRYMLTHTLLTSFLTLYIGAREKSEEEARRFIGDALKAFSMVIAMITAALMLFAPAVARIIAPTYTPEVSAQLAGYLRLFAPALLMFLWMSIFHALLNAHHRFILGELDGLNQSIILILMTVLLQPVLGVQVLAAAFLVYVVWNTLFLGACSRKYWRGALQLRGNPWRNDLVRQQLRLAGPLLLGYSAIYINQQVGKILVSGLAAGTVTAMGYAGVLSNLVCTFVASFASILFPYVTAHISRGEDTQAAAMATKAARLMTLALLPITVLTVLCAEDVVAIVFGRGAFGAEGIRTAAAALAGYAVSFVPHAWQELYSRLQYGYQNSKTPMVNSTVGIIANIILSIVLCPIYGVWGVALASSVSVIISGILNVVTAKKCNAQLRITPLLRQVPWMVAGGAACAGVAVWLLRTFTLTSPLLRFALATIVGGAAYLLVVFPVLWRLLRGKDTV